MPNHNPEVPAGELELAAATGVSDALIAVAATIAAGETPTADSDYRTKGA